MCEKSPVVTVAWLLVGAWQPAPHVVAWAYLASFLTIRGVAGMMRTPLDHVTVLAFS